MYVWTAVVLAVGVAVVLLGWHAKGGTTDPTALPPGHRLSHTTVVINSAILVLREGLETILVLLLVMNWFFHKVYWTGWISHHHKRRRGLLASGGEGSMRAMMLGLLLLGFTSVYRECFEVVIFLQNLRELYGSSVVLEGVTLGAMFTAAAGVLTFALHQKLPYKRLLIITGVMLLFVLLVSVGEEVQEMQLAGWIGTTNIPGLDFPGWMGTWFSLFGNWQTIAAQLLAFVIVIGSYVGAQYLRVWPPARAAGGRRRARAPGAPGRCGDGAEAVGWCAAGGAGVGAGRAGSGARQHLGPMKESSRATDSLRATEMCQRVHGRHSTPSRSHESVNSLRMSSDRLEN